MRSGKIAVIFAYRDEVLSIETRKDNMLSFHVKYSNLLDSMCSNSNQYLQTNDVKYKSQFYSLRNTLSKTIQLLWIIASLQKIRLTKA
jgi:hypothetical protein